MFKALLVIYIVSIGTQGERGGSLTTTPFETMEQCEAAIKHAEDVLDDWHYGDDKSSVVPTKNTMKCFEIPPGPLPDLVQLPDGTVDSAPIVVDKPPSPRTNKRWNDL